MKKQVFVFLMCVLVLLAFTASAQTYKDEVIYVLLTPAGEVTGVYVVNGFETDTAQEVTDYGVYKQVVNLTGSADIPYKDGVIALSLPAGRFFYQGDRETNDLPWTFDISYTLDGAAIAPEDLSGVTGHLVITFAAQSVTGMEAYTAGTTLQASITLNASKCLNIQADRHHGLGWQQPDAGVCGAARCRGLLSNQRRCNGFFHARHANCGHPHGHGR